MVRAHWIKFALRLTAALLFTAAAVVCGGLLTDVASAPSIRSAAADAKPTRHATATTNAVVPVLSAVIDRPLRPALADTPDAVAGPTSEPVAAAVSPKQLRLVGTVGSSIAMVQGPDDAVALVEVGDDVEGADVVAIRDQQVELRLNGRVFRLEKSQPKPEGGEITIR